MASVERGLLNSGARRKYASVETTQAINFLKNDEIAETGVHLYGGRGSINNDVARDSSVVGCCDPRSSVFRYNMLFLLCFVTVGMNFTYDTPAGLEETIIQVMEVDTTHYDLLYFVYAWPNILGCFVTGFLVDRVLGLSFGTFVFTTVACLGQGIWALGAFFREYWLMLVGRTISGIGGEISLFSVLAFVALWFRNKEINLAFGIVTCVERLGGVAGLYLNIQLYRLFSFVPDHHTRLGLTLTVGVCVCVVSMTSSLVAAVMDHTAEKKLVDVPKRKKFSLKDIKEFSGMFWLVQLIYMLYMATVYPFVTVAQVFFERKFAMNVSEASLANSLIYAIPAVLAPFCGYLFQLTGYNIFWAIAGIVCALGCHVGLAFGETSSLAYMLTVLYGLSYSITNCAMLPLTTFIINDHQLATAFGVQAAILCGGYALFSLVIGIVIDRVGYFILELILSVFQYLIIVLLLVLYMIDSSGGRRLNVPGRLWRKGAN